MFGKAWGMKDVCHYDEMKVRFPDEWVLVGDPEIDENHLQVVAGEILWHTSNRDELYREAQKLHPREGTSFTSARFRTT